MSERYIPHACDAVIAYCDATGRVHCVACCDRLSLEMPADHRVYGDIHDSTESNCDTCGQSLLSLSLSCEREHDEQQARFAKGPVTHLVEMGMIGMVRCRIY